MVKKKKIEQEEVKQKIENKRPAVFSKEQIISSKKFQNKIDVLRTILEDNKMYTIQEVENKINEFMKGAV